MKEEHTKQTSRQTDRQRNKQTLRSVDTETLTGGEKNIEIEKRKLDKGVNMQLVRQTDMQPGT